MKILLVNPPNSGRSIPEEEYGIKNLKMIFRGEPLALEVLAGNLDGHEVIISDLKAEPDCLEQTLYRFDPDLVGITGMTCEANTVLKIARDIKKQSNAVIVVGGHHASCDPEFFNKKEIDFIISGLGKLSFRKLVDALEKKKSANNIEGIAGTDPSKALVLKPKKFGMEDLVDECSPRYDLVEKNRDKYVMSGVGGKMGFVVSAFGCTHRCFFCSIPNMTGGRYLSHSADAILRDMNLLKDMPVIRLVDANTFGNIEIAEKLGLRILDSGLDKKIVADVRSDTVVKHPELFKLWKKAGLATAVIGFEEISDLRLKAYNKNSAVETNIKAMEILKELEIKVIGDFIVSPDYTHEDFEALEFFVKNNPIDLPLPAILTPIPGTPLYRQMKERLTVHNLDYYTFTNAVMPTRMNEREFYENYSLLLETFIGHIKP
ncbi:MAG: B12-binding domain-containing radical SAM protein [Desulfobacterales bacterium]|nr:B12-binding domain-containing radical SAM protein [Desulfobacterales bacterium]